MRLQTPEWTLDKGYELKSIDLFQIKWRVVRLLVMSLWITLFWQNRGAIQEREWLSYSIRLWRV